MYYAASLCRLNFATMDVLLCALYSVKPYNDWLQKIDVCHYPFNAQTNPIPILIGN